MKVAILGAGAISRHVQNALWRIDVPVGALIVRPARLDEARRVGEGRVPVAASVADMPDDVSHVIDCAGHSGLRAHGEAALLAGLDVITLSVGALADEAFADALRDAAARGGSRLHLASGAIGALDALRAAGTGRIDKVRYVGRKPPQGWAGSHAEKVIDLNGIGAEPQVHFCGSAREAALLYPKNANVAASVALAGIGFDRTEVELVADPGVSENIHLIQAVGDFGSLSFEVAGKSLPDAPRSSALAAMSVVAAIRQNRDLVRF